MHIVSLIRVGRLQAFGAGVVVAGIIGLFGPTAAIAQSINVSPVTLQMAPGQMATSLSVTNKSTGETTMQARIYAWSQMGGIDHLSESDNVVAAPRWQPSHRVAPRLYA